MNKKPLTSLSTAIKWLLMPAGIALPVVSWAQPPQGPEQIIVTGTRLPDPNLISTSPIQVVSAQEIAVSGRADVSDILQLLPQSFANDLGQDLGNRTSGLTTAGGVATADLRGLGPNRTLVLVNGRRLGSGSPFTAIASPAPDLDQIPARLIERVEVVTGGASAVYGSDAIAGVVNFITKTDFEGVEFDAQTGFNWHNNSNTAAQQYAADAGFDYATGTHTDGRMGSYSLLAGANTPNGRGNFTVYLGYQSQDGVKGEQRDFGAGNLFTDTVGNNVPTGDAFMSGSANSNLFETAAGDDYSVFGNQFVPWGSEDTTPPQIFNYQPWQYMARQYRRTNAGLIGHYDLNDHVQPYVEFSFMNDKTHQEIAPSALFFGGNPLTDDGGYLINCSNPLLSAQQAGILCTPTEIANDLANPGSVSATLYIGRRNVEGGGRTSDYEHTNYRAVAGLRGDIGRAWSYDGYAQSYYVQFYNTNNRYLNFRRITDALQVTTDGSGNPVCVSGPPCVPYNIWQDGGVTQEALAYLYTDGTGYGTTSLHTAHADFTADLGEYGVKLRGASQGLALNVGYETRTDAVSFKPDEAEQSGLLSGYGGAAVAIDKSVNVDEYFAEIRIPLIQDKSGVQDLSIDAGFRQSDYSTSGTTNTSKFEIQYAPSNAIRLRASLNKAIRAPSLIELYNPQLVGKVQWPSDPCAPTASGPAARSLTDCLRTVSASQAAAFTAAYGNGGSTNTIPQGIAGQLSQLQGGNVDLQPETANSDSLGVSITPEGLKNFTASVDYWHIKIDDEVAPLPLGVILNGCLDTGNPLYCNLLVRQSTTFSLDGANVTGGGYFVQTNQNIASGEGSGLDLQLGYRVDLARRGSVSLAVAGSYMLSNETTSYPGAHTYDCTGLFGATCQTVNPTWRHIARATWSTPKGISATLSWRYISEVKEDNNDSDPTLMNSTFNGYDSFNAKISAQSYFDLAASYAIEKIELRGGINNITDKNPPLVGQDIISGGAPNTYSTYDMFGRQVFFAVNVKF